MEDCEPVVDRARGPCIRGLRRRVALRHTTRPVRAGGYRIPRKRGGSGLDRARARSRPVRRPARGRGWSSTPPRPSPDRGRRAIAPGRCRPAPARCGWLPARWHSSTAIRGCPPSTCRLVPTRHSAPADRDGVSACRTGRDGRSREPCRSSRPRPRTPPIRPSGTGR